MLLHLAGVLAAVAAAAALVTIALLLQVGRDMQRLRILAEQGLAGTRGEADTTRERLTALGGAIEAGVERVRTTLSREQGELRLALRDDVGRQFETTRTVLEAKLRELREGNETKLAEIQKTVNEQLHAAVEKQMDESFKRVIDQFTAVQKAMSDVQAVTAQIGDIKRLFSNVKTRGGWGEAQVRAMLDDILPAGAYETNRKLRSDSDDVVEFVVLMPGRGDDRPLLPIDAKFPVQDYERLLAAADAGDAEAERTACRRLETTVRQQAKKIAAKYINPPVTVEFAVMYLPTDALFAEVARIPGLIDEIGRECRVLVLGPSLFPALLRTIHLGFLTLTMEQKAAQVSELLGATRTEMIRMDKVLEGLARNAGTMSNAIEQARRRTRVVTRKLRDVEAIDAARAEQVLELESEVLPEEVWALLDLFGNAVVSGVLLGGFYAAVTIGVSISFGMLDIVNIAHPAFIILGSYCAYIANAWLGIDPIVAGVVLLPAFYLLGAGIYQVYHLCFERRGEQSLRGLAFFFGLLFITEVLLVLVFGVDYRLVEASYIGPSLHLGVVSLPLRLLVPCVVSLAMIALLQLSLSRSFIGRAILAVAQDELALRLMAADPVRIKRIAFGVSIATASVAGAILIVIQPVEPSLGREYIGRVFAICVLGGLGSFAGTVVAAIALGTVESLTATFYGPSWSPAVAFGFLLIALAVRPAGVFGR